MSEISLKREYELTDLELEAISGGGGSDKGSSETVSGGGGGTVSGTAAGGSDKHSGWTCGNWK